MNTTDNTAPGALTSLRALGGQPDSSLAALRRIAAEQARLLRDLLTVPVPQTPARLSVLIPSLLIEYITQLPTHGIAFWARPYWHIRISASDPSARQTFTVLHQFKHIIDHPLRQRLTALGDADWEELADYFAGQALREKASPDPSGWASDTSELQAATPGKGGTKK
ncbi:hypothetical protein RM780_22265 [Streptomyces sp. DSM 44917]|uniref:IrrE N-terminal-like domain-containing protein n=1 Tax=Streptomyces boetiae TaxID=3075541 RepID=A0ABU2LDU4_9ACTN|nr:ImmA/IrrE family metallo-endopeptidase [Streptomyces sp. DSM 44917]MDT0309660.1 hypothetical protein [Streptomyces sp. DSM 44917]